MGRKDRRALARSIHAKGPTLGRKQLAEDACHVCAFIATQIIAGREQDFRLSDGTLVDLGVNKRLEPPLGVRFPRSAAKRHPCLACGGKGNFPCKDCNGTGRAFVVTARGDVACPVCRGNGKVDCEKCAGQGYTWTRDDYAPACLLCSQFIMAWLGEREKLAMVRNAKESPAQKIILPSTQQAKSLAKGIILP